MSEINYIVTDGDMKPYTVTNRDTTCIPQEHKTAQPLKGFSEIFDILDNSSAGGVKASRMSWIRSMYIQIQVPDDDSKMDCPYLYISTVDGKFVPWIPTYEDLFARDWIVVS